MLGLFAPRDYAQGDHARDENNKESFEITALLRSLSFGGTDERSEMSEKRECFRSFFELRSNSIDRQSTE